MDVFDSRICELDTRKAEQSTVLNMVSDWSMDEETGIITITKLNGEKIMFDLNIEKIPVSFSMSEAGVITMKTEDGTEYTADISKMIPVLTFNNSDTIMVNVTGTGKDKTYTFDIKDGSITPEKLNPNYLAEMRVAVESTELSAESAAANANSASKDAKDAKQYRDEAEQFKNQAFSGTPEGYERLADNVDGLMEKSDRTGITGRASGESIHLTDTTDNKAVEFALIGKATQKQYSGKNKLNPIKGEMWTGTVSINADGVITTSYDNTSGTATKWLSCPFGLSYDFKPNHNYKVLIDIMETTGNAFYCFISSPQLEPKGLFDNNGISLPSRNAVGKFIEVVNTVADFTDCTAVARSYIGVPSGESGSIKVRVSIYDADEIAGLTDDEIKNLPYEPFVGGTVSPNPEYDQDITISGADGSVEVKSLSNNLINPAWSSATANNNGIYLTNNMDNSWTFSGEETDPSLSYGFQMVAFASKDEVPYHLKRVGKYTVTVIADSEFSQTQNQFFFINLYYNGAWHNNAILSGTTNTMNLTEEILAYDDFKMSYGFWISSARNAVATTLKVQLEYGETATPFEQFKESTTNISTPNGLAGINGANDKKVKYADGTGQYIQRIGKETYNSSSYWGLGNITDTHTIIVCTKPTNMDETITNGEYKAMCNMFTNKSTVGGMAVGGALNFFVPSTYGIKSVDDWKALLGDKTLEFYYVLAEPIITDLSAEEVAELEAVQTFYPTTNILNDAGCGMEIEYVREVFVTTQTAIPFSEASEVEELKPGDTLGILFGKIKKFMKSGGGTGTTNYEDLDNKPSIDGTELSGNKSLADLGIQPKGNYLEKTSTVGFTQATTRANISASDSIVTMFGKIAKWFADLKSVAFSTPTNNLLATVSGSALDATQGKVLNDKIEQMGSNIQYGSAKFTDGKASVIFPKAFTNIPVVIAIPVGTSENNVTAIKVTNITVEGCDFVGTYTGSSGNISLTAATFNWLAIGI